jgi:mevalonate pyrophosphate decarboxylase
VQDILSECGVYLEYALLAYVADMRDKRYTPAMFMMSAGSSTCIFYETWGKRILSACNNDESKRFELVTDSGWKPEPCALARVLVAESHH